MKEDLRTVLTKRMLKEGLLRCLESTPLSRITVSGLCREAGVNRATFYNHYESPAMVLRDIVFDYARRLGEVRDAVLAESSQNRERAIEECLAFLQTQKAEIRILFSENAENHIARFGQEIIDGLVAGDSTLMLETRQNAGEDRYLYAIITASACYGLLRTWVMEDIQKTPGELVEVLLNAFGGSLP